MSMHSSIGFYRKIGLILAAVVIVIGFIVVLLNPLLTLLSFKQLDEGLYMMNYYGNGLFPKNRQGLLTAYDQRIPGYLALADRMTLNSTALSIIDAEDSELVGHNHNDANPGPLLCIVSKPRSGNSAIFLTNLTYLGYEANQNPGFFHRFPLFLAPTLAVAGINETGLVVTTAAVRPEPVPKPEKPGSLTGFSVVQLILRKADTVSEALELLEEIPLKFEPWPELHYLLADAAGNSAIVELIDGRLAVSSVTQNFQVMSNFYVHGSTQKNWDERVVFLTKQLQSEVGRVEAEDVMNLLEGIAKMGRTQWSAVFNSQTLEISLAIGEDFNQIHHIQVVK